MGNAEIVEQWAQAVGGDWELLRRVCQPDHVEEWHQSGERTRTPSMRRPGEHSGSSG